MRTHLVKLTDRDIPTARIEAPARWHFVGDEGDNIFQSAGDLALLTVPPFEIGQQVTWKEVGDDYAGAGEAIARHMLGAVRSDIEAMIEFPGDSLIVMFKDMPMTIQLPDGFCMYFTLGLALVHGEPTFDPHVEALILDGVWKPPLESGLALVRQVPPPKQRNGNVGRKSQRLWADALAETLADALLALPS